MQELIPRWHPCAYLTLWVHVSQHFKLLPFPLKIAKSLKLSNSQIHCQIAKYPPITTTKLLITTENHSLLRLFLPLAGSGVSG